MKDGRKLGVILLVATVITALILWFQNHNMGILNPAGTIAAKERGLIFFALALSALVVVPVFVLLFWIAWRYRASNKNAVYQPDWDHSRWIETAWWLIPTIIISILAVLAWQSSHQLDPYRALASNQKPLNVQVVAMDWKWLFIYPEQHVAAVNFVQLPINRPVNFEITSDAPMNSFWIPQLAGQIYAMSGMVTQLHITATKTGDYRGSSANISGTGFAGMTFTARASSQADFNAWAANAAHSPQKLSLAAYGELAKPSQNNAVATYAAVDPVLFDTIVENYMLPTTSQNALLANSDAMGTAQ